MKTSTSIMSTIIVVLVAFLIIIPLNKGETNKVLGIMIHDREAHMKCTEVDNSGKSEIHKKICEDNRISCVIAPDTTRCDIVSYDGRILHYDF